MLTAQAGNVQSLFGSHLVDLYMSLLGIHERLARGLNRPVNEAFTRTVARKYFELSGKDEFLVCAKALGISGPLADDVYKLINEGASLVSVELQKGEKSTSGTASKKKSVQVDLGLDLDDEQAPTKRSTQNSLLDLDEETQMKPTTAKFKRIRKQDATRIRGVQQDKKEAFTRENDGDIQSDTANATRKLTLAELAARERNSVSFSSQNSASVPHNEENFSGSDSDDVDAVAQDRDWYTTDEMGHAMDDANTYDYTEAAPAVSTAPQRSNFASNGGYFNAHGEYIDYDHDTHGTSRVPITSHYFVPPFLKHLQQYLDPKLTEKGQNGPTINPVKDPNSELAVSAKQGSFVVNEKRSKTERAKQARDLSRVEGGALGKVLEKSEQKRDTEEAKKSESARIEVDKRTITAQRRSLPAFAVRRQLLQIIAENQVTVVIGETGSGKTTQLTQFLMEDGYGRDAGASKMIGCTQPRRVAAMSVAKRVSEEYGCRLGDEVGYSIRFEDVTLSKTVIKYMTEGILLREMLADPNLEKYSCIIMDEAHERSVSTDVLLGLFRNLTRRRKDLKLVITSATMNAGRFVDFFGDVPRFTIPGRTFPVDTLFAKASCSDYVDSAVNQVVKLHLQNWQKHQQNDGDVLVFMTGQEDIEAVCALIADKLALLDSPPPLEVCPIYSTMPADLQQRIFEPPQLAKRKVVVATNIAETSLTVDGIRYVVDCGLVKMKVYNPKLGMDALQVVPVSLANAQQRSGRAGRTAPGVAYRLYTERAVTEAQMYTQPVPEIQRTNLTNTMLLLKSLRVDEIALFPFLDPPPTDLVANSLYQLWAMLALDNRGNLTDLGENLMVFPIEAALAKLVLVSCRPEFACSAEILTIVSMLSVPSPFFRPKERANESDAARERFSVADSDHLTLLNVYDQWHAQRKKGKTALWCTRNFLHHKSLVRARDIRSQLELLVRKSGLPLARNTSSDTIRKCICAVYFHQLARLAKADFHRGSAYTHMRQTYMNMHLHPTSALSSGAGSMAEFVVYHELVLTAKEYMSCVTAVDPVWLLEFGAVFFGTSEAVRREIELLRSLKLRTAAEIEGEFEQDRKVLAAKKARPRTQEKPTRVRNKRAF